MTKPSIVYVALFVFVLAMAQGANGQTPLPDPKSPQYRATGEQDRSYTFPGTSESIPYHIYVPTTWNASKKLPLVVVTHGANQPATAPFQRPMSEPTLAKTAEARGFIVAAVTGYHANATAVGGWNVPYKMVQVVKPGGGRGGQGGGGRGPAPAPPTEDDFKCRDGRAVCRRSDGHGIQR